MIQLTEIQMIKSAYIFLLESFLRRKVDVLEFQKSYFETFQYDPNIHGTEEMFMVLDDIFNDLEDYSDDPDPAEFPPEIGEDELRLRCAVNLEKLKTIAARYPD